MGDQPGDYSAKMERNQTAVEFTLGVVIPSLLASMLFSYVLMEDLFNILFYVTIGVALLTLWPAKRIHDLHYTLWSRHTLPLKLITGMIGMIYISAISVFSVSMISVYEGLTPEEPLTFVVMVLLLLILITLLAYNSKNKELFLSSEKRHYRKEPGAVQRKIMDFLGERGEHYKSYPQDRKWKIELGGSLVVKISPVPGGSEVLVENITNENVDLFNSLKDRLDG